MTISNEPERHEQLKRLLDEQRAAAEQDTAAAQDEAPSAAAVLEAFGGFTLTASGARRLAGATGETLGQVEQAARRQGMNVERQTEIPRAEVDYAAGDRTLFPADPSTEHMLPDLADDEDLRVVARVGDIEMREEWRAREWLRVRDERSGLWVEIRRAHCGAECECSSEVRLVEQPGEEREAVDDDALSFEERQLDAVMREQMAQWPDDTLALITVGELRAALRKAHDHGSGFDEVEDCAAFLDQLVRDLPVSVEERAGHGLPDVGRPESFERPGSAYDRVLGHGSQGLTEDDWRGVVAGNPWLSTQTAEHGAVTPSGRFEVVGPDSVGNVDVYDRRQAESPGPWLILPEGERRELVDALAVTLPVDSAVAAIVEQLRYAVDNGVGLSLDAGHAAALARHLGRQR